MKVIELNVEDLKLYENNPRQISEQAIDAVANSIKEFGFKIPIILDANNVIVAGHTRVKAAKKLGLSKVPCIIADDLTPEQIKAFRLADNKVAEFSNWDFDKLNAELEKIDFDMAKFGFNEHVFNESFIDDLMEGMEGSTKDTESDFFTVSFTLEKEYKSRFDDYIKEHGKTALKDVLIGAVLDNA